MIEDDYDAEYRYDRAPLGALQGLAPDRVVYMGTVEDARAPALRLGWMVLPAALSDGVVEAQAALTTTALPTIDQLALAQLIDIGRLRPPPAPGPPALSARRDALLAAVAGTCPGRA